ncbi:MAG: hypothetical protein AVDCRST_MAG37-164 [uncultured Rubrobacteraceae bacterium]|uniref:Uncharacterized protein n=1 Tax=uncultured Rubrobacteraceae bacterium TaxID=349277 RepID=A0A6J4PSV3_9ACTN|nr:MAG: hypothetical protein AVDCRST_MAG37-164 [uncultured Rubrobacteraceae bacterium]
MPARPMICNRLTRRDPRPPRDRARYYGISWGYTSSPYPLSPRDS